MRFVKTIIIALSGLALIQVVSADNGIPVPRCEYCSEKEYTQEEADALFVRDTPLNFLPPQTDIQSQSLQCQYLQTFRGPFAARKSKRVPYETAGERALKAQFDATGRSGDEPPADLEYNGYKIYLA
ncbi:hypothetical protein DID88_005628 [Monilinia fructigena]|uniref:Uncharacterized protein n=1 Tax=Monilinia fructigena TaxID=38457 RepID=A0A395J0B4_9HELO|nr:hypothetical protein DID88_005628 [Monilinia fructigena]